MVLKTISLGCEVRASLLIYIYIFFFFENVYKCMKREIHVALAYHECLIINQQSDALREIKLYARVNVCHTDTV